MNIIDIIIILFIIASAMVGFKKGFFNQIVSLCGITIIFIIAFSFKDEIADFFFDILPLVRIGESQVLTIMLYELIAFLIIFSMLGIILKIILFATNILETLLKFTVILGIPSKIMGAIVGAVEGYLIAFVVLLLLNQPVLSYKSINNSLFGDFMLRYTPVVSSRTKNIYNAAEDLYKLKEEYKTADNKEEYDLNALNTLLKYKIVKLSSIDKLVKNNKLKINNIESVLEDYR